MTEPEETEPRPETDPRLGTEVDRYTIVRLLGKGGMGRVYEARHTRLARRVAIKFLLPDLATRAEVLRRFENEAKASGALEHPNLAAVIDLGRAVDGAPYLVMEYLHGEDCARLLRRTGPLPVTRTANIVLQACRGVEVAHAAGVIHRDLKPENLFVIDAGDGSDQVKVLDFGIAKLRPVGGETATRTGSIFGTTPYMSPEQARGAAEIDARTDVWSLGVVLYEFLTGRKPFEGEQPLNVVHQILNATPPALQTLRPGLPAGLVAVVETALRKDVDARYSTIGALAAALAPFAGRAATPREAAPSAQTSTQLTPATTALPTRPPSPRRWRGVGTALAFLAGVGAVGFAVFKDRAASAPPAMSAATLPAAPPVPEPAPPPAARPPVVPTVAPPVVSGQFEHVEHGEHAARRRPGKTEPAPERRAPAPNSPAKPALQLDPNPY